MSCPEDIAEVVAEIVQLALLRIRAAGWQGDAGRCAIEADHVHNLVHLLADFREDALRYYWDVERPSFIGKGLGTGPFEPLWKRLESLLQQHAMVRV